MGRVKTHEERQRKIMARKERLKLLQAKPVAVPPPLLTKLGEEK